jgi:hypothetical protein
MANLEGGREMFKKISLSVAAILAVVALAKPPAASAAVIDNCRIVTPVHREYRTVREVRFHRDFRDHRFEHRW